MQNIYFSGISGTGIGPLAEMAKDAEYAVFGSDTHEGAITSELRQKGIDPSVGPQDGAYLRKVHAEHPIDWFVYTSSLSANHSELAVARGLGIRATKRDDFLSQLISNKNLKLVAIAGTHGKTTTTAMLIWVCHKLDLPVSYLVGSTLSWGPSGHFDPNSEFFIYEADEYDRNFLAFHPWLAVITTETYDHPDIYKTPAEYHNAFAQFRSQSQHVIAAADVLPLPDLTLPGELRRNDARFAFSALSMMILGSTTNITNLSVNAATVTPILNTFPGAGRRFEHIADGVYSDYAHHPEEVAATIKMAHELAEIEGYKGVTAIYEPHQNSRQHQVRDDYHNAFADVDHLFWLPTYLTREDENLSTITPADFIATLANGNVAQPAQLDAHLAQTLRDLRSQNHLILLMTAGPADPWLRQVFNP